MAEPVDVHVLTRMIGERELRCELMRLRVADLELRIAEQDAIIEAMSKKEPTNASV